jgi:hypothetical protein
MFLGSKVRRERGADNLTAIYEVIVPCWNQQSSNVRSTNITNRRILIDQPCGVVVIVPGYRSRSPGSIPAVTRFSEKQWVWNGVHSAS